MAVLILCVLLVLLDTLTLALHIALTLALHTIALTLCVLLVLLVTLTLAPHNLIQVWVHDLHCDFEQWAAVIGHLLGRREVQPSSLNVRAIGEPMAPWCDAADTVGVYLRELLWAMVEQPSVLVHLCTP